MTASNPSDATIFYTTDGSTPAHSGGTATSPTQTYNGLIDIGTCGDHLFKAIEYHAGYLDSDVSSQDFNHGSCGGGGGGAPMSPSSTVTIFSVWDGDWAILEEYATGNVLVERYLQGYHGLVKTFVQNVYYYQDELGSTSHIANATGQLLEYYKYDLYGKPQFFNSTSQQLNASAYGVNDLFTGQRWVVEIGLYDDRNRFMSPDLGRFLQPDPIGFKGDASNLYRYCGNDWANRSDPMGLEVTAGFHGPDLTTKETLSMERDWNERGALAEYAMLNVGRMQVRDWVKDAFGIEVGKAIVEAVRQGNTWASNSKGDPRQAPKLDQDRIKRAVGLYKEADSKSGVDNYYSYTHLEDGRQIVGSSRYLASRQFIEGSKIDPPGVPRENGHVHPDDKVYAKFSRADKNMGNTAYVVKNHFAGDTRHPGAYDLYHHGWEYRLNSSNQVTEAWSNP